MPMRIAHRAEDMRLRITLTMRLHRIRGERRIPDLRSGRVGSDGPAIVPVESALRLLPGFSRIPAKGDAAPTPATLVNPISIGRMEQQRMAIAQRAGPMIRPGLPTIRAPHHGAEFNSRQNDIGISG